MKQLCSSLLSAESSQMHAERRQAEASQAFDCRWARTHGSATRTSTSPFAAGATSTASGSGLPMFGPCSESTESYRKGRPSLPPSSRDGSANDCCALTKSNARSCNPLKVAFFFSSRHLICTVCVYFGDVAWDQHCSKLSRMWHRRVPWISNLPRHETSSAGLATISTPG